MAHITIEIRPDDIRYSPSALVNQGDTVTFHLDSIIGPAIVFFDDGTCLTAPNPLTLNGQTLQQTNTFVALTALSGPYPFTVTIPDMPRRSNKHGGEHEVKKGGLEVSTDPPK
ncbi:hypothetical protein DRW03_06945 [Corallococcus sp. H22C18031201]|nr:hypothetical protein DRW03_06945 [Corallococcus sp. H22C18031201]